MGNIKRFYGILIHCRCSNMAMANTLFLWICSLCMYKYNIIYIYTYRSKYMHMSKLRASVGIFPKKSWAGSSPYSYGLATCHAGFKKWLKAGWLPTVIRMVVKPAPRSVFPVWIICLFSMNIYITWLLVDLPLWKIWVYQLGLWHSQYMEKIIQMFQTTNQ